jgi:drug/metabolite transporter (DMT)-like permease
MIASSGMLMISGGLVITGVSFALGEYRDFDLLEISGQSLGALIYLIVIITIVGFTDFYWLLRVTTPSLANTFAYVSPVIAVILGALLLHEPVTIMTIIAMSVILVGVALMVTTTGKEDKKEEEKKKKIQK